MKKHIIVLTCLVLSLLFLQSCVPSSLKEPPKALFSSSCELPCWQGIIPGITTEDEVLSLAENIPDVLQHEIQWVSRQQMFSKELLIPLNSGHEVTIFINNNQVSLLIIGGAIWETGLSLGVAIDEYGDPDCIIGKFTPMGDMMYQDVQLHYPVLGLLLFIDGGSDPDNYDLNEDSSVMLWSTYPQDNSALRYLLGKNHENIQQMCTEWQGYGEYPESTSMLEK